MPKDELLEFQAFRENEWHSYRNMDPDDVVAWLDIDTETLLIYLRPYIENKIKKDFDGEKE